jgi:signal transduction histidine kinase
MMTGGFYVLARQYADLSTAVTSVQEMLENLDAGLQHQRRLEARTTQALPGVTSPQLLANRDMIHLRRDYDKHTAVLQTALTRFQWSAAGYTCGLAVLMALLTFVIWRQIPLAQTERRRLEQELLEISSREQQRIGEDLHDGLGQHLTGIAFLSKVLTQNLTARAVPEADAAAQITHLVNQAISQVRELVRGLSAVDVEAQGLLGALQQLAAHTESLFGIACHVTYNTPPRLHDAAVATHLYRIAQEAVSNAVKHGEARQIMLTLTTGEDDSLTLRVHDDGLGLPDTVQTSQGIGLRLMRSRASTIGAALDIQRGTDGGTSVVCALPVRTNKA